MLDSGTKAYLQRGSSGVMVVKVDSFASLLEDLVIADTRYGERDISAVQKQRLKRYQA